MVDVVDRFLKDGNGDVRACILKNLHIFLENIHPERDSNTFHAFCKHIMNQAKEIGVLEKLLQKTCSNLLSYFRKVQ